MRKSLAFLLCIITAHAIYSQDYTYEYGTVGHLVVKTYAQLELERNGQDPENMEILKDHFEKAKVKIESKSLEEGLMAQILLKMVRGTDLGDDDGFAELKFVLVYHMMEDPYNYLFKKKRDFVYSLPPLINKIINENLPPETAKQRMELEEIGAYSPAIVDQYPDAFKKAYDNVLPVLLEWQLL